MDRYESLLREYNQKLGALAIQRQITQIQLLLQGLLSVSQPAENKLIRAGSALAFVIAGITAFAELLGNEWKPYAVAAIIGLAFLCIAYAWEFAVERKRNRPLQKYIEGLLEDPEIRRQERHNSVVSSMTLNDIAIELLTILENAKASLPPETYNRRLQGGIAAIRNNLEHLIYDSFRQGDPASDQNTIQHICRLAISRLRELKLPAVLEDEEIQASLADLERQLAEAK